MQTIIIAAMAKNRVIGKGNDLPWRIPEDFKHFKETTKGHAVIMGRMTFESMESKPLPDRVNIVLSGKMQQPKDKSFFVSRSLEQALKLCEKDGLPKAFIIGGGSVYEEALEKDLADMMILSEIGKDYDGDTRFPKFGDEWKVMERDEREGFEIVTYRRE
jgi:dihydrofolate reductase